MRAEGHLMHSMTGARTAARLLWLCSSSSSGGRKTWAHSASSAACSVGPMEAVSFNAQRRLRAAFG
uniref:Uncharacterized protein n=1 Tax=Arundo donax TaxID=35708 RepID=A0A0A8ZR00_ARUDO